MVMDSAITNIMGGMENSPGVKLHSHRHKLKQRFDIIRKLGQGTYGKVQLAVNKETGQEVAIKTIKKARIENEKDLIRVRREIQIMSSVQHPHIIHIYEVFENREKMVLVMEYAAGGELYDYLSERKSLIEEEARRLFRQVAGAVFYCHKHKICHRDLKLENILLDSEGNAKIADFGLSNVFDERQRLDTFCGSPLYASPEIVKGVPYIGPEVDCWSLGVLLYTLVYGAMPFDGTNFRRLVKQITQADFYEPATPSTASELIRRMLAVDSNERATIVDVCNHWWANDGYSVSCLKEAEELANQTPVRLDLLLSLAPKNISPEHMLIQPDDDDSTEKSDKSSLSKLPPTPDGDSTPAKSRSMGAVIPSSGTREDSKASPEVKKLQKKATTVGKPPSVPSIDDEKKSMKKKEVTSDKERVKKREASMEREKIKTKKREKSIDREKMKEKEIVDKQFPKIDEKEESRNLDESNEKMDIVTSNTELPKEMSGVEIDERHVNKEDITSSEKSNQKEASTRKPSHDIEEKKSHTKTQASKSNRESCEIKETEASIKEGNASISKQEKPSATTSLKPKTIGKKKEKEDLDDTQAILKETAEKIKKVEELMNEEAHAERSKDSHKSPTLVSPRTSVSSSQVATPGRSRTGSESSTGEIHRSGSKSESSSRRHSKVFSKAALFESGAIQSSSSPPDSARRSSGPRPGTLNMSDLAKKFEEKPAQHEKRNRVITPFKVSDAKKAFEAKAESNSSSHRASIGNSESSKTSPQTSLSPSRRNSTPSSPPSGDKVIKSTPSDKSNRLSEGNTEKYQKDSSTQVAPEKVISSKTLKKEKDKEKQEHESGMKKMPSSPSKEVTTAPESSESESEAERMLKQVTEKREKLEKAKKAKMKNTTEEKTITKRSPTPPSSKRDANRKARSPPRTSALHSDERPVSNSEGGDRTTRISPTKAGSIVRQIPITKEVVAISPEQVLSPTPRPSSVKNEEPLKKAQIEITLKPTVSKPITPDQAPSKANISPVKEQENLQSSTLPEPHLQRARRERIIPIMFEEEDENTSEVTQKPTISNVSAPPTKKAPPSAAVTEPIKKSRRERIIPIAVEGEGLITPPMSESGSMDKVRQTQKHTGSQGSFGRGRGFNLDRTESFSSAGEDDEDDEDAFQILTAESLFSTLLSRVRALTRKMATEDGRNVPISRSNDDRSRTGDGVQSSSSGGGGGGFWSSFYSPPRESTPTRMNEALSRGQSRDGSEPLFRDSPFWLRSGSRDGSEAETNSTDPSNSGHFSTLPRADFFRQSPLEPLNWQHHKLIRDRFFSSDFTRT